MDNPAAEIEERERIKKRDKHKKVHFYRTKRGK